MIFDEHHTHRLAAIYARIVALDAPPWESYVEGRDGDGFESVIVRPTHPDLYLSFSSYAEQDMVAAARNAIPGCFVILAEHPKLWRALEQRLGRTLDPASLAGHDDKQSDCRSVLHMCAREHPPRLQWWFRSVAAASGPRLSVEATTPPNHTLPNHTVLGVSESGDMVQLTGAVRNPTVAEALARSGTNYVGEVTGASAADIQYLEWVREDVMFLSELLEQLG